LKLNKIPYRLFLLLSFLGGCSVSHDYDTRQAEYARKNSPFIKEMAEYALLFSQKNDTLQFSTDNIADRKKRKKMERVGRSINITYYSPGNTGMDSTITFKNITITHGIIEFLYDFALSPRNMGTDTAGRKQNIRIQASERVYYIRRPFPLM